MQPTIVRTMSELRTAIAAMDEAECAATERSAAQAESADDPRRLLIRALIAGRRRDWAAATTLAGEAARRAGPAAADYHHLHAEFLIESGRTDEAIESLDRAIDTRADHGEAHAALAALLARRGRSDQRYLVTVITPTVGTPYLARALASVQAQTYPRLEHLVIIDGPESEAAVRAALPAHCRHPVQLLTLPCNTGAGGYRGHRAYGAAAYLAQGRFLAYLDEDNWYEPGHLASLMGLIESQGLAWAYSLRRIVDPQGRYLAEDDCMSLGRWPMYIDAKRHLVDTSCYVLRTDLAVATSPLSYRRNGDLLCSDELICRALLRRPEPFATSGLSTLNYTWRESADYFLRGNAAMRAAYAQGLPWRQQAAAVGAGLACPAPT